SRDRRPHGGGPRPCRRRLGGATAHRRGDGGSGLRARHRRGLRPLPRPRRARLRQPQAPHCRRGDLFGPGIRRRPRARPSPHPRLRRRLEARVPPPPPALDRADRGRDAPLRGGARPAAHPPPHGRSGRAGAIGRIRLPRHIQTGDPHRGRMRGPPRARRVPRRAAGAESSPMSSTMGRAALVVSGGILLSRILGFAREMVLAALLGRSIDADLYQAAFTIPDFLFFLMAGGYLTLTFVPIVSRHLAAGEEDEANRSFTAIARVVGGLMLIATAVTMIWARPLTERVFSDIPAARLPQLVGLVRIVLPAQFFFVLGSLYTAVQYAHRRFLTPTLAPIVYNIAIIGGGTISYLLGETGPEGFVRGALTGAIVGNFGLQWWGARRLGLRWRRGTPLRHPSVAEYFALALPLMIGQSAVGLDEVFFRYFGQFAPLGDIAALNYARRLQMVPVGVIAQAAGVASYPFLARLFAEGRRTEI